ncbi:MAG: hypothetical protein U5L11_14325 [Arhodomonas sp.]|nr:hypothetical protein [Arhodomonas sp.]
MDGRARLVDRAVPLLRRLPPDVYRHMMVERLAGHRAAGCRRTWKRLLEGHGARRRDRGPQGGRTVDDRDPRCGAPPVRLAMALLLQQPGLWRAVVTDPAELRGGRSCRASGCCSQIA